MSCLKLHWPQSLSLYAPAEADWQRDSDGDDAPVILSFPRRSGRSGKNPQQALLTRARIIHENRCCPICNRAAVVPVDSEQALLSRDRMPIPGTGTLLGFECDACGHTWDA
ncbi:MAG: hypothetical protein ACM3U2_12410 [Deltaproteobacteria bacterium]